MKCLTIVFILILPQLALAQSHFDYVCPASLYRTEPQVMTEIRVVNTESTPTEIDCHFRNTRGEEIVCYRTLLPAYATEIIRPDMCRNRSNPPFSCNFRSGSIFLSSTQPVSAVALIYVQDVLIGFVKFDPIVKSSSDDSTENNEESRAQPASKPQ